MFGEGEDGEFGGAVEGFFEAVEEGYFVVAWMSRTKRLGERESIDFFWSDVLKNLVFRQIGQIILN